MKYFNNEQILTMTFHKETGYWIIVTSYQTLRLKPETLNSLIKDGVIK